MEEPGWMSTGGLVVILAGLTVILGFLVPMHGFGFNIWGRRTKLKFSGIKPGYLRRIFYWLVGLGVLFVVWQLPSLFLSPEELSDFKSGLWRGWSSALFWGFGLTLQIHVAMFLVMYWFSTVKGNAAASSIPLITPLSPFYIFSFGWFLASDVVQDLLGW